MKKLLVLLISIIGINCSNQVFAQELSIEETKAKLCGNKWFLRRLEQDGKMFSVPKEIQGLKMVFRANGTMYSYLPTDKEAASEIWTWSITKTTLTIQKRSGKEVNFYELKDFIGYKLYLTDKDETDMPTFVFEISERIEGAKSIITEPLKKQTIPQESITTVMEKNPAENNVVKGQWRFTYTKGEKMGKQWLKKRVSFPVAEIQAEWKEGYYITDICYGVNNNIKEWLVITSKNKFSNQVYQLAAGKEKLKTVIEELRKSYPDYYISHLTYGEGKWVVVASKGTGYTGQTTIMSQDFPEENIKTYWTKSYQVTDMAYGDGGWTIVMSKGSSITKQHYHIWNSWEQLKIDNEAKSYKYLTESVKTGNKFYMLFSEDKEILLQENVVETTIPEKAISNKWADGYFISRAFFY